MRAKLIRLLIFYSLSIWFYQVSKAILPTHLFAQGVTLYQQIIALLFGFSAQLLILILITKINTRFTWPLSLSLALIFIALQVQVNSLSQYYLAGVINGIFGALFFVPYNIVHFQNTPKDKTGFSAGIMFAIGPLIALFSPLIAGYLANYNLTFLWTVSIFSFLVAIASSFTQPNHRIQYSLLDSIKTIASTRIFIFLEGVWDIVIMAIIPIYTLHFISTPLEYGKYLAYLAAIGTIAGLFLGKLTDKRHKRSVWLYPVTLTLALFTLLLIPALKDLTLWLVVTGLIQFCMPIFWNLVTTLVVDQHTDLVRAMPGREIALVAGRLAGIIIAALGFYFEKIPFVLIIFAIFIAIFPIILYYRTRISKEHLYF